MIEAFYRDNYHIVYGYLLSLCADPTLAEDLTSETLPNALNAKAFRLDCCRNSIEKSRFYRITHLKCA